MIAADECAVFAVTFAGSAAAPGPEIAALLGRALSRGLRGCVPLALGIVLGKLLMLAVAVAGLAALVAAAGPLFTVLRYCGALYLEWLAVKKWRRAGRVVAEQEFTAPVGRLRETGLGLAMTLSNPIAVAFYMALLPGIIDLRTVTAGDYAVLAGILVGVMSLVVLGYGLTAEAARRIFKDSASKLWLDRSSAIMFAAAGLWIIVR